MKNKTRYVAFLLGGLVLTCLAACSNDDGYESSPVVDPNCIGASFDGDNIGYKELEDTDAKELVLTVSRDKTDMAATVAIEVQANTEDVFDIPQSVSFEAGQAKTDLVITFEDAKLKKEYAFEISLEASAVNPYKGNGHANYTIQCFKWVDIPGVFTYADWAFSEYNEAGKDRYDVKVQRVDGENRYRIVDPFLLGLEDAKGEVGEPHKHLFFTINPTNKGVSFVSYFTGYLTKGHLTDKKAKVVGMSSLDFLGIDDVDSKYDPVNHQVTFNVYYYGDQLIGQRESVLELPEDFEPISAAE